ncbi:GNAT family protein [uncultured Legionella sp.]|uniref:GNAT family N-acetyltransferase n=1 Tax=uncultured Legionella sp. TaxID=210934 RepID=UPI002621C096|nr:GNAT family protein [uncultured Legionella sp.]
MINYPFDLKILTGKNIQLEPLDETHYDALRVVAHDERIWAYMPMSAYGTHFERWFQYTMNQHQLGSQITYTVRRSSDAMVVGCRAYYDFEIQHRRLEVGYGWFTPAVWGTRINHECLWLMFRQAIEDWRFNRIQIATDPNNKRSYNTLKKLGAKEEGILRQHMIHHNGALTDTVIFSLLADEWAVIKEALWHRLEQ